MTYQQALLAGVAGIAVLSAPAQAAEIAPEPAPEAAPEQAQAQAQDQDFSRGDVIIVTARRRQETAQAVPLAISVIKADSIESTGNFNVTKLPQLAPTLQVYISNPRNTSVNIRGLGVPFGLTSDGFEQGVGIYVDDVYNSRVAAATFDFLDVAQVEVLRGPQGTLYGKNTTAGAINITTNQPTFDFEGRAEVTLGNLDYKQAKAAVSGPLSDTVAARLAISSTSRRGTIYNVTTKRWINEQDNIGLRGQLLFQPNDDLSITLSGDYSKQDAYCCGTSFVRLGTTQRALNRQYDALVAAINAATPERNYAVTTGGGTVISCTPAPASGTALAAQCGVYQPQETSPSASKWNVSYDLNVNYKLAPDVLAYATYAKSFKTLGINQNGLPLTTANVPDLSASTVKPESVNHFEAGFKTQFWDRRATFNLSAFLTEIKDFQATVNGGQFGTVRGYLANAEKVRSAGIEADFKIRTSDRFTAYANAAYTDAKYVKFTNAPCPPELSGGTLQPAGQAADYSRPGVPGALSPRQCDISGQALPGVSKYAFSYGAEYNVPANLLGKEGQVYFGVDGNYRSDWNSNASPSIYTKVEGYALTNLRAGCRSPSI